VAISVTDGTFKWGPPPKIPLTVAEKQQAEKERLRRKKELKSQSGKKVRKLDPNSVKKSSRIKEPRAVDATAQEQPSPIPSPMQKGFSSPGHSPFSALARTPSPSMSAAEKEKRPTLRNVC
jgi:hypothetical protein